MEGTQNVLVKGRVMGRALAIAISKQVHSMSTYRLVRRMASPQVNPPLLVVLLLFFLREFSIVIG